MRFRLRTKFLLSMLLILAALTSTSLLLVRRRVEQQLRRQIVQDLRNSVATFQNVQRLRVVSLRRSAQLLANLPISRALMTTAHAATIQDASRELWTVAGTDLLVLSNRTGEIMGIHSSAPGVDRDVAQASMRHSLAQDQTEYWWRWGNHVYEIAIQPIYFGSPAENRVLGFLAVGYEIDDRVARELSQVAASQVAFWYGPSLVRSTLLPAQENALENQGRGLVQVGLEPVEMPLGLEPYWISSVDLAPGSTPAVRLMVLKSLTEAIGRDRILIALDSKDGRIVVKGWRESTDLTADAMLGALEPYCSEFLYTHVDNEGLMQGTNIGAILEVRRATTRRVTAAGGITTQAEIDALDRHGVDSVVGMAVYTGKLELPEPF